MKPVKMFMWTSCPHCRRAFAWMEEAKAEHPEYAKVDVEMIDERVHPEIAGQYDYYFVPTYYVGGEKVHEGPASKDIVCQVYETACKG